MNNRVGSIAASRAWAAGVVVFGGLALGADSSAQAASFTNGSFELGTCCDPGGFSTVFQGDGATITGWLVGGPSGASVDYIGSYWEAADGSRSIDLSGSSDVPNGPIKWGEISQTFDTISGQTYQVSFELSGNPDGLPQTKVANAEAGSFSGSFAYDLIANGTTRPSPMGWVLASFVFTALGDSTTLTFRSDPTDNNTYFGPAIDNVSVAAVPLPAALPLFAGGLGLLAWMARRRRGAAHA